MINRIRFIGITVTDIHQALDFYVSKLGFRVVRQMPLPGDNQFVMVAPHDDGSQLVFSLPAPGRTHLPNSTISFETGDVRATCTELTEWGVKFTRQPAQTPWGGWEAVFVDPFENSFMLQEGGLKQSRKPSDQGMVLPGRLPGQGAQPGCPDSIHPADPSWLV
jgi:catechol 2,3-dioxygenase-like lactoylglutathione lyase family enzyme